MFEDTIDSFWERLLEKKIAYIFNRTALGLAPILGAWNVWNQNWWPAFLIFGVMFPAYFLPHRITDAS